MLMRKIVIKTPLSNSLQYMVTQQLLDFYLHIEGLMLLLPCGTMEKPFSTSL